MKIVATLSNGKVIIESDFKDPNHLYEQSRIYKELYEKKILLGMTIDIITSYKVYYGSTLVEKDGRRPTDKYRG